MLARPSYSDNRKGVACFQIGKYVPLDNEETSELVSVGQLLDKADDVLSSRKHPARRIHSRTASLIGVGSPLFVESVETIPYSKTVGFPPQLDANASVISCSLLRDISLKFG